MDLSYSSSSSSSSPPFKQPGSKLLPLNQIPSCQPNTRVRFLGCIASYDMTNAQLSLSHPPSSVLIKTDISLLTSSLSMGALRDGEWVNVIGDTQEGGGEGVLVTAITLWSAGGINLGKYEKGVKGRLEADLLG
ncbi:telomere capping, CST complex subunit-domain-containing protein [Tuber borchii]|uniref:Telomere capping, CST complex subunit-domain-containing protein n=1 Tax=Tuber borchii TaxID=42251 RepID=A0A2T7A883_TUBBO|nr:telomere capping, CST complex subunit-domain-containing protein [Tuber borchii]